MFECKKSYMFLGEEWDRFELEYKTFWVWTVDLNVSLALSSKARLVFAVRWWFGPKWKIKAWF